MLEARLEVALPIRDRGIDLIVYADRGEELESFIAVPIQMKAASKQSFGIQRKYEKFHNLIFAFVWGLDESIEEKEKVTYALTYEEALHVANRMGWTNTSSWKDRDGYGTTRPSKKLLTLLEPYRMSAEAWKQKIKGVRQAGPSPYGEQNR